MFLSLYVFIHIFINSFINIFIYLFDSIGGSKVRLSLGACIDTTHTVQEKVQDLLPTLLAGN